MQTDHDLSRNIRRTVLPNGLILLTERMEHLRSIAMGVWVRSGSRSESPELNGLSHFVEHMVFKGTHTRSARQIARDVDAIGGNLDAFTSKENICFSMKVLDQHLPVALDVLSDLVMNPTFAKEDLLKEQGVILEEIKMDEDNPDYLVSELFTQNFWQNHPLGRPILGTRATVESFNQKTLFDYHNTQFRGGNIVLSAAGNLDHDDFAAAITKRFGILPSGNPDNIHQAPEASARITLRNKKSLEQVQLCMGIPSPPIADSERYSTLLLNTLLGGGMSSRLFQTVREERGLAYSIYSDVNPYRDAGVLCVFAGTSGEKAPQVIQLVLEEFRRFKEEPIPTEELERAKDQLKGNILLGLESSSARMSNLARQEMYFQHYFSVEELIDRVNKVTPASVQAMSRHIFQKDRLAVALLGRLDGITVEREQLVC